jgi:hypothetical protein
MDWSFGDVFWAMFVFFAWVLFIWMFIAVFADIFHRHDLSGWAKAGWTALVFVLPLFGILIYMVGRPRAVGRYDSGNYGYWPTSNYSAADEISKLNELQARGAISKAEYERLRDRAVA